MSNAQPENHPSPIEHVLEDPAAPQDELAGALLGSYYAPLFQLCCALLNAYDAAHTAALDILCEALCESRRLHGKSGPQVAIYQIALRILQSSSRPYAAAAIEETPRQQALLRWIDQLGSKERQFFLLYYLVGLQAPQVAQVLHVGAGAANTQIEIFQRQLAGLLDSQEIGLEAIDPQAVEQQTRAILSKTWSAPQPTQEELTAYTAQVLACAAERRDYKQRRKRLRNTSLLAAGALGLMFISLGAALFFWNSRGQVEMPPPSDPKAASTLVLEPAPLTRNASSEQIKARMLESGKLWNTLWADVQMTDYGPPSYIGPAKSYRAQVWIHQPSESLEVFGVLGQKPNSVYILYDDQQLYENPVAGESYTQSSLDPQAELLHNPHLQQLFFPERGPWFTQGGTLQARKMAAISGRRCIVVDWIDPQGQRLARLWLDAGSGLILKRQDFTPGPDPRLTFEALVSDIRYESEAPPIQITDWMDMQNLSLRTVNERQTPGKGQVTPTPTLAGKVIQREPLPSQAPPPGLIPSQAQLLFQYPQGAELTGIQIDTADVPVQLFADGFFLSDMRFAIPWGLHCQRSADGGRIAFNTASDGTTRADPALRWFSLDNPDIIYQPFPGFQVSDFAFAPDSRYLAAAAQAQDVSQNGIYLLDTATGEYEQLLNLYNAESLVWSLDGEYLVFLGQPAAGQAPAPTVVHVNTGLITHQIVIERLDTAGYEEWPVFAWDVEFPKPYSGLQACAQAPTP